MSFDTLEQSIDLGQPVLLYEFTLGTATWRYTSSDVDQEAIGFVWAARAIQNDSVKQTGESVNDALQITMPANAAPIPFFGSGAPSTAVQIVLREKHYGSGDVLTSYVGEITHVNLAGEPGRAVVTCETIMASMEREGLRHAWQRSCTYTVYDPVNCKLDRAAWQRTGTVLRVSDLVVGVEISGSVPDSNHFANGWMEWVHPQRGLECLSIDSSQKLNDNSVGVNTILTVATNPSNLIEGLAVTIIPGCDFSPANCQRFGNYDNYGGAPDLPGTSPFDGNPVF